MFELSKNEVQILGTTYKILYITGKEYANFENCEADCDKYAKLIHIQKYDNEEWKKPSAIQNPLKWLNKLLIHEITHAFIEEAGVSGNDMSEENICDFVSEQLTKIYSAFQECKFVEKTPTP